MKARAETEVKATITKIVIELTVDEAVALQRAITSVNSYSVKDRLYQQLTDVFRIHDIPGGLYV
jgi:hypothetical protein